MVVLPSGFKRCRWCYVTFGLDSHPLLGIAVDMFDDERV